jgi:DUF1365 family protein
MPEHWNIQDVMSPGCSRNHLILLRPRFWSMLCGIIRFYREAPAACTGDGSGSPFLWAQAQMRAAGLDPVNSRITLLTMPRLLGYGFNPISVYFCHGADGALSTILYKVKNTFGQRHSYFIPVDAGTGGTVRQSCNKAFYVSPFMDMDMHYDFTVLQPPGKTLRLLILANNAQGPVLAASLTGLRAPFTDAILLRAAVAYPLLTLKVMAGIHWEAAKFWLKGRRLCPRPAPPATAISFVTDSGTQP